LKVKEVLNDYKDQFKGTVFVGKRSGFMDEYNEELKALEAEFENVKVLSINQAIDQYCEQVKTQMPCTWMFIRLTSAVGQQAFVTPT
jgi:CRISPR-associated protein Cst2